MKPFPFYWHINRNCILHAQRMGQTTGKDNSTSISGWFHALMLNAGVMETILIEHRKFAIKKGCLANSEGHNDQAKNRVKLKSHFQNSGLDFAVARESSANAKNLLLFGFEFWVNGMQNCRFPPKGLHFYRPKVLSRGHFAGVGCAHAFFPQKSFPKRLLGKRGSSQRLCFAFIS